MIDFLDELGNFKQKIFTLQNVNFFYILQQWTHNHRTINESLFFSQTFKNIYDDSTSDSLTIYDGANDQSTQIAKLIGNLGSFNISSSGNSLFVRFESNWGELPGFHATIHYGNPIQNTIIIILPRQ